MRKCDIVCITGIQESTKRNIHNTSKEFKSSYASAIPLNAIGTSKKRPDIMETRKRLPSTSIQNQTKIKSCTDVIKLKKRLKIFIILSTTTFCQKK
jgi:hypothetical protein